MLRIFATIREKEIVSYGLQIYFENYNTWQITSRQKKESGRLKQEKRETNITLKQCETH